MDYVALSGNLPYERLGEKTISEAMAMKLHIMLNFSDIDTKQLVLDELTFTTMQCVKAVHEVICRSQLSGSDKSKVDIKDTVDVVVVTSPYHIRRTMMMWESCRLGRANIRYIIPVHAETTDAYLRDNWFDPFYDEHGKDDPLYDIEAIEPNDDKGLGRPIRAIMNEYFKINGGRVVCEF